MIMKKAIFISLLCIGGFAVHAQIPQPDPDTTARHFLIVASIGNLQEASAGQLAVQKGKLADVRSFGQMMVKDHTQAEQQLLQLATSRNYNLPTAATDGIQPDLNLKNAEADFDRLYVHGMLAGHNNTVQTFENYAVNGKDPAVKAFAQQMLPTFKAHLVAVKALDEKIKDQVAK
jgi:putative membrane protein